MGLVNVLLIKSLVELLVIISPFIFGNVNILLLLVIILSIIGSINVLFFKV